MPTQPDGRPTIEAAADQASAQSDLDETATAPAPPRGAGAVALTFGPPVEPGEVGTLGPYRILKQLGAGGMGAVYAAVDTRLERRLALKVMLPEFAANASAKERFLREAKAAARIKHDNVVTVYEADEREGVPYIAMEFLEGCPLDAYLKKKGNPTIPQILRVVRETAAGLGAAHKHGLVHRDIKPANLWLEAPQGRVKVLDFGLARPVDAEAELTKSGVVVGTPAYMSPEQARGEHVDHRTDLFSLGVVLYRLCGGRLPFQGPTTMAVLMALGTQEPSPVRELNPEVPESLAALTHQLLAKDAAARPQNAAEVIRRVEAIEDELAAPQAAHADAPSASQPQVMYVPIHVTAAPPEQNPFADLDVTQADSEASRVEPAPAPKSERKKGGSWLWPAVGLAALVAVAVAGVVIIKNKIGTTPKIETPDEPTVKGKTGPAPKPSAAPDPDRKAAEYVLSLGGFVQVNGDGRVIQTVADLPKERFTLTGANLNATPVTDAGLAVFKDCKGLTSLSLIGTQVTDAGLAHFKELKSLTQLTLTHTAVSDAGLAHLKECKELIGLHLVNTKVTGAGLAHLKDCKGLTLVLNGAPVTDAGLVPLKDCKGLTDLWLSGTGVTDAGLTHLKDLKGLTFLDVRKSGVTAKGLAEFHAAVPGCKIEHDGGTIEAIDVDRKAAEYALSLGGSVWVNGRDGEIKAATELPKERFTLTAAFLDKKPVTDAGLANFRDCKNLTSISLGGTGVTDAGLANFKDYKALVSLNLNSTRVTGAGLAHLKDCKGLMKLYLGETKVTDAGLAHFKELKNLTYLNVLRTKVTAKGLEEFHAAVPGCKIDHDGGTIQPKK